MNMTFTEKHLIKDISNKAFRLKYGVKSKKAKKREKREKREKRKQNQKRPFKSYYETKTKKERQQWWVDLTPEQQAEYIEKRQTKKAKERKLNPPKELEYNPKYPWMTEGVNDSNREQWWAMIKKKNPWLKVA